jgi:hypothetical protein
MTGAPSVMSLSSAPDMLTNVHAANPAGNQIPAVHFGTAVLAARKVSPGPVVHAGLGDAAVGGGVHGLYAYPR